MPAEWRWGSGRIFRQERQISGMPPVFHPGLILPNLAGRHSAIWHLQSMDRARRYPRLEIPWSSQCSRCLSHPHVEGDRLLRTGRLRHSGFGPIRGGSLRALLPAGQGGPGREGAGRGLDSLRSSWSGASAAGRILLTDSRSAASVPSGRTRIGASAPSQRASSSRGPGRATAPPDPAGLPTFRPREGGEDPHGTRLVRAGDPLSAGPP